MARRRTLLVALVFLLALAGVYRHAAGRLQSQVEQALGPRAHIGHLGLSLRGVAIDDLVLPAPSGWPADSALRAARIVIAPDLRSLWSERVRIARIDIDAPQLSVVRTADGRLRVLPGLLDRPSPRGGAPARPIEIGRIALHDGALELFDASVRTPPLKLRLDQVEASLSDVQLPGLRGESAVSLRGTLRGVHGDGSVALEGSLVLATRDSHLTTTLRHVDLAALEPYLIKTSETGVRRGTLDLDLDARVRQHQLLAPGRLVLSDLELAPAPRVLSTFMGMPRQAVIASLKNRDNRIDIAFTLQGDLDSPKFSLNETLAIRVAAGMAQGLGVSLIGVASGVGTLGQKSIDAVGKLFGRDAPSP